MNNIRNNDFVNKANQMFDMARHTLDAKGVLIINKRYNQLFLRQVNSLSDSKTAINDNQAKS